MRELFRIGGIARFSNKEYLTHSNCQIKSKTLNDDSIRLHLKRDEGGLEGDSSLRVKEEYKDIRKELLRKIFTNENMIGLTLNELMNLDTNLEIESYGGRMQVK